MSTKGLPHARSALALGLGLGLSVTALACRDDSTPTSSSSSTSSSTATSTAAPPPGRVSTSFDTAAALGRAEFKGASVTTAAAHGGSGGLEVRSTGGDAYVRWDAGVLGEGHPYWTFRAWMRVVDWTPSESVDLFTVRNLEVTNNFDLFVGAPYRRLQWDLYRQNSAQAPPFKLGRWYFIEAKGSFATSTFTAEVRIDGLTQPSIRSTDQTPSAVSEFILGSIGTAKNNRSQFDDLHVELADSPLPFLGLPAATTGSTPPSASSARSTTSAHGSTASARPTSPATLSGAAQS